MDKVSLLTFELRFVGCHVTIWSVGFVQAIDDGTLVFMWIRKGHGQTQIRESCKWLWVKTNGTILG